MATDNTETIAQLLDMRASVRSVFTGLQKIGYEERGTTYHKERAAEYARELLKELHQIMRLIDQGTSAQA